MKFVGIWAALLLLAGWWTFLLAPKKPETPKTKEEIASEECRDVLRAINADSRDILEICDYRPHGWKGDWIRYYEIKRRFEAVPVEIIR